MPGSPGRSKSKSGSSGALYVPKRHDDLVNESSTIQRGGSAEVAAGSADADRGGDASGTTRSVTFAASAVSTSTKSIGENGGGGGYGDRRAKRRGTINPVSAANRASVVLMKQVQSDEMKAAVPLVAHDSPTDRLADYLSHRATKKKGDAKVQPARVSTLALLSYSTVKERWLMALGIVMAAVSGSSLPAWLVLLAKSLDKLSNIGLLITAIGGGALYDFLMQELMQLVLAFAVVGCISLVSGSAYVALWTYTGERQTLRIKQKFVQAALRQDAAWFDTHHREELPTMVANSMIHINGAIGRKMVDTFANLWSAAGCLAVAMVLNAPLALVMLCVVPVVGIVVSILTCFIRKSGKMSAEQFASAGAIATEVISGIKTVASLCAEKWALSSYEGYVRGAQSRSIRSGILSGLASGLTGFLFYGTYTIAFLIGTYQVSENSGMIKFIKCFFDPESDPGCQLTGAAVMCCIYGVILCATFFGMMAPGIQAMSAGRQAAVDIFATINRIPPIDASSDVGDKLDGEGQLKGKIELQRVLFIYPTRPNNPIFRDFSLTIEPGQSVAFVGPSGSGKSTVTKLLLRFYDPVSGKVVIDGADLSDLSVRWWRDQVGYVAQEPILFPGTMRENIACGKPGGATEEEVIAAAKAACAHEFILDFEDGYDTFYSGASIQLSGGQMQRISIARAIIRNPAILLLDEATSALDTNSERQVQEALANIRRLKRMTTVTIAHRLSTVISCDQIAVISDGTVAELGTHRSLLEEGGIYATLCESQGITLDSSGDEAATASVQPSESGSEVEAREAPEPEMSPEPQEETASNGDIEKGGAMDDEKKVKDGVEEEDAEPEEEELAKLSRLWKLSSPEWAYMCLGTFGALIVGALPPTEGILTAQIVANYYISDDMWADNLPYSLGFLALAGASLIGNMCIAIGFSVSGCRLTRRMRTMAFESIVRRSMGWFDIPDHSTGELTSRLEGDAEAVAKVTGWALGYRIRVFATLVAGVLIALLFAWQIGVIAICCVPLIMGAAIIQSLCFSKRFALQQDGLSPSTILEQGLRGVNAVQAYNLQGKVYDDFSKALQPAFAGKVREGMIAGGVFGFSQFAIFVSFAILFYVGAQLLVQVKIGFVEFFTSVLAVMFGALGIASVNADFNAQQDGLAAAARIFKIVDEPYDDKDPFNPEGERPQSLNGEITFQSCWFHYPTRPEHPIYFPSQDRDGFSLSIAPKESVAFVGKSGCGKSTALQLVERFYDVSAGTVRLDGENLEDLNISWLRQKIGYVGQQPVLFAGTVRDNIMLGNEGASDDEIVKAAQAANAHDFIMKLSDGYDTDIGSGGSLLSGGQKQRLAIARAIVKNPPILVLDEATSALDNESERVVQEALDDLRKKQPRTTLVVAHRLVTVKDCDKIAVLGGGGVKELGDHSSLLKQKGLYHELWMKQMASKDE